MALLALLLVVCGAYYIHILQASGTLNAQTRHQLSSCRLDASVLRSEKDSLEADKASLRDQLHARTKDVRGLRSALQAASDNAADAVALLDACQRRVASPQCPALANSATATVEPRGAISSHSNAPLASSFRHWFDGALIVDCDSRGACPLMGTAAPVTVTKLASYSDIALELGDGDPSLYRNMFPDVVPATMQPNASCAAESGFGYHLFMRVHNATSFVFHSCLDSSFHRKPGAGSLLPIPYEPSHAGLDGNEDSRSFTLGGRLFTVRQAALLACTVALRQLAIWFARVRTQHRAV